MTITTKAGGLEISTMIDGYRVSRFYIGYTVKDARAAFIREFKDAIKNNP